MGDLTRVPWQGGNGLWPAQASVKTLIFTDEFADGRKGISASIPKTLLLSVSAGEMDHPAGVGFVSDPVEVAPHLGGEQLRCFHSGSGGWRRADQLGDQLDLET